MLRNKCTERRGEAKRTEEKRREKRGQEKRREERRREGEEKEKRRRREGEEKEKKEGVCVVPCFEHVLYCEMVLRYCLITGYRFFDPSS